MSTKNKKKQIKYVINFNFYTSEINIKPAEWAPEITPKQSQGYYMNRRECSKVLLVEYADISARVIPKFKKELGKLLRLHRRCLAMVQNYCHYLRNALLLGERSSWKEKMPLDFWQIQIPIKQDSIKQSENRLTHLPSKKHVPQCTMYNLKSMLFN